MSVAFTITSDSEVDEEAFRLLWPQSLFGEKLTSSYRFGPQSIATIWKSSPTYDWEKRWEIDYRITMAVDFDDYDTADLMPKIIASLPDVVSELGGRGWAQFLDHVIILWDGRSVTMSASYSRSEAVYESFVNDARFELLQGEDLDNAGYEDDE